MDGLDVSDLSQLDEDMFDKSQELSDEDFDDLPLPDCIGLDAAIQDEEKKRKDNEVPITRTKSDTERERELSVLKPNSIRREILQRSLQSSFDGTDDTTGLSATTSSGAQTNHVMNIVEKAGMKGVDKERINRIIREVSEGSLFYKRQAKRQEEIHKSIEKMLNKVQAATSDQEAKAQSTCDNMLVTMKDQQVFNKVIVHFDLDMFFAAVEIRDDPSLAKKPIAVGGDSMVCTSNYIARKFGVRAAMPGFIAKKLCPELTLIKPNGYKYREASKQVFDVLEQYDQDLSAMSLDEAYLDLTEYIRMCLEREEQEFQEYYDGTLPDLWWTKANEVVQEIRGLIYERTKLTCSAGISCNTLISKIATDINKPNGQFMVKGYRKDVDEFIQKQPVEKVPGIGKVNAQFLNALEIKTCGDIHEKRHILPLVFYPVNVKFYLKTTIGDGSTRLESDDQRKSKSIEQTFPSTSDPILLLEKLNKMCSDLCTRFLKPYRISGRTVSIKLKQSNFQTLTRSCSLLISTNDKEVIFKTTKNLLNSELKIAGPSMSYRLLGIRLSNLNDETAAQNQTTIDVLLKNQVADIEQNLPDLQEVPEDKRQSDNQEALPCPYCFKLFQDFSKLEAHVESCQSKVGCLDPYEHVSQRIVLLQPKSPEVSSDNSSGQSQVVTPASASKTKKSASQNISQKRQKTTCSRQLQLTDCGTLSQATKPTSEPLQCPFCFHFFSNFNCLERHAGICVKNKS